MIGGSFLSLLPQGLLNFAVDGGVCGNMSLVPSDDHTRKRRRDVGGAPLLVSPTARGCSCEGDDRPRKRFRGQSNVDDFVSSSLSAYVWANLVIGNAFLKSDNKNNQTSDLIKKIPCDVLAQCLSFLGSTKDRHALQNTCKLFRKISDSDYMLSNIDVFGDIETGKGSIIREHDTPATASAALAPFARAGNLQALFMMGIVKCYCYQDLKNGITMLKIASSRGYVRSSYTLGIILRDALYEDATKLMSVAASRGYIPALLEILPAREMKEKFGEPNAEELRKHLDPVSLNRLLLRDYVNSAELRSMNTSHCWNPLCGKWAYKASSAHTSSNLSLRMRRSSASTSMYDVEDRMLDPPSHNEGLVPLQNGVGNQETIGANINNGSDLSNATNRQEDRLSQHHSSAGGNKFSKECCGSSTSKVVQALAWRSNGVEVDRVARMKMCSRCCRAKYCSKLCQVYDWRSSQHKMECQFL